MTSSALPFAYNDFHGGLNTHDAPYLLQDNESRDLTNVQGTSAGAIVKRTGLSTITDTTSGLPAAGLHSLFAAEATAQPYLLGVGISAGNDTVVSVGPGQSNATTTLHTFTGESGALTEMIQGPVVSGQGPVYMMNGSGTPQQWTGSGATANWTATDSGGTVPNGTMMIYNQNQVFVSGVSSTPSRLYWSGIADPTAWNPANLNGSGFMDFDPNDGQGITGIGTVGPYILVGKPRKLWVVTSVANAVARMISNNVGISAHRSIATGPEGTYFLAEDRGVYVTNGSKLTPISDKIRPTLDGIISGDRGIAAATYFNAHYYLSISTTSAPGNDTTLDYDATLGSWWKHDFGMSQSVIWHQITGNAAQMFGATNGTQANSVPSLDQCFTPGVYTDHGNPMTWAWRGPWQSPTFYRRRRFPTPWFRKRLRQIRVEGSGTVDFSIGRDFTGLETLVKANCLATSSGGTFGANDGTIFGAADGSLFGAPNIQRFRGFSLGVANAFSMVFGATSTTPDTVLEYTMMLTDRKDLVVT